MTTDERLTKALALPPLTDSPMSFPQFLQELAGDRKLADTAPAVVLRAISDMGCEEVDQEKDPERKAYLKTLSEAGIPSWKAFYNVCGSQLFALRMVERFLKPAAANGAQLKKILIIEGGPGSGKDFFKDGIKQALEATGKVYAVKGCPDHENPVNLLKLLSDEQLAEVAAIFGVELKTVQDMLLAAGSPCEQCYRKVMGTLDKPLDSPNLSVIQVERIRLSERSAGVFEWQPGQDCSLVNALRRANRGFIAMPDAFLERIPEAGKTDERLILLDATQYRRLPGSATCSLETVSPSPLDVFMMASTNAKAFAKFLETLPDQDAFTGRSEQLKLPYNLVRVEEERAYRNELARYKKTAEFGPLAIKMIATLAVISRYGVPKKSDPFVHPLDRLRLLQGEEIKAKTRAGSEWEDIWSTKVTSSYDSGSRYGGSSTYGGYGGGYGGYSSGYGSGYSSGSSSSSDSSESEIKYTAMPVPADMPLSPAMMWQLIGSDEGLAGLDMRFMLNLLSRINSYGLGSDEKRTGGKKPSRKIVTALESIMLLRSAIYDKLTNTSNLTPEQKAVLQRCQKWLGGAPGPGETWTSVATSKPGLIEGEYRRLLKDQLLQVFCPDYHARAQQLFEEYKLHAVASVIDQKTVKHPIYGDIPVDHSIVDDVDRFRLGKVKNAYLTEDDKRFRKAFNTMVSDRKDEAVEERLKALPEAEHTDETRRRLRQEFRETWETIPELANAIRAKLDSEIAEAIEKLLSTEVTSNLKAEELERLEQAKRLLEQIGYHAEAQKSILDYAKRVKVWAHKS